MQDFNTVKQENPLNRHMEQPVLPWHCINKQMQRYQFKGAGFSPHSFPRAGCPSPRCQSGDPKEMLCRHAAAVKWGLILL